MERNLLVVLLIVGETSPFKAHSVSCTLTLHSAGAVLVLMAPMEHGKVLEVSSTVWQDTLHRRERADSSGNVRSGHVWTLLCVSCPLIQWLSGGMFPLPQLLMDPGGGSFCCHGELSPGKLNFLQVR